MYSYKAILRSCKIKKPNNIIIHVPMWKSTFEHILVTRHLRPYITYSFPESMKLNNQHEHGFMKGKASWNFNPCTMWDWLLTPEIQNYRFDVHDLDSHFGCTKWLLLQAWKRCQHVSQSKCTLSFTKMYSSRISPQIQTKTKTKQYFPWH